MNNKATVIFSNCFEHLSTQLEGELGEKNFDIKVDQVVIVPNSNYKTYLNDRWLNTGRSIIAAIRFLRMDEAIAYFRKKGGKLPLQLPSKLCLQVLILQYLKNKNFIEKYPALNNYFDQTVDIEKKAKALSKQLSDLFILYGLYHPKKILENDINRWQVEIFNTIFQERRYFDVYQSLMDNLQFPTHYQAKVFVFGFDYMPPIYYSFFEALSKSFEIKHYLFAPSQYYLADDVSDSERLSIQKRIRANSFFSSDSLGADDYLTVHNPLLSNWSKMGQEHFKILDSYELQSEELYKDSQEQNSFLQKVQKDLFEAKSQEDGIQNISSLDDSICVHGVPSSNLREVEILFNNLLYWTNECSIEPHEILVLSPQLQQYSSFIHFIFGSENSPLPYRITGLEQVSQSLLAQAILSLLSIFQGKWTREEIMDLLNNPCFHKKQGLSSDEIMRFSNWIEQTNLQWGWSVNEQKKMVKSNHLQTRTTWLYALEQILFGLVSEDVDLESFSYAPPIEGIELADVETIEKLLKVFKSLKQKTSDIEKQKNRTLSHWALCLQQILEEDLWVFDQPSDKSCESFLRGFIRKLHETGSKFKDPVEFSVLHQNLVEQLKRPSGTYHANYVNAIQFAPMKCENIGSYKAIYFLGLQEENFFDPTSSLNLLPSISSQIYFPSQQDEKRYAFLKALCSAKSKLWISYQHQNRQDGKPLLPSLVLQELLSYLDRFYCCENEKPSSLLKTSHPSTAYNIEYFEATPLLFNYSKEHYKIASSLLYDKKAPSLEDYFLRSPSQSIIVTQDIIDLRELRALAKHPVQFYLQKGQGLYLERDLYDNEMSTEFELNFLQRYLFRKKLLKTSFERAFSLTEKSQSIPYGVFGEISKQQLSEEDRLVEKSLSDWSLEKSDFFTIQFEADCKRPTETDLGWILPPIEVELNQSIVKVIGEIPLVSKRGFVVMGAQSLSTIAQSWPDYLSMQSAAEHLEIDPSILFLKDGSVFSEPILNSQSFQFYISYYFQSLQTLSPLMPDWIESFIKGSSSGFSKCVEKSKNTPAGFHEDPYLKWFFSRVKLRKADDIFSNWQQYFAKLCPELSLKREGV